MHLMKNVLRLQEFRHNFRPGPPLDATEGVMRNFVRVNILVLLSIVLFADKLSNEFRLFLLSLFPIPRKLYLFHFLASYSRAFITNDNGIIGLLFLLRVRFIL